MTKNLVSLWIEKRFNEGFNKIALADELNTTSWRLEQWQTGNLPTPTRIKKIVLLELLPNLRQFSDQEIVEIIFNTTTNVDIRPPQI